jgi:hypothetical protein
VKPNKESLVAFQILSSAELFRITPITAARMQLMGAVNTEFRRGSIAEALAFSAAGEASLGTP